MLFIALLYKFLHIIEYFCPSIDPVRVIIVAILTLMPDNILIKLILCIVITDDMALTKGCFCKPSLRPNTNDEYCLMKCIGTGRPQ